MLPAINQLVDISLNDGENFSYKSRVADISDEFLAIEIPINKETGRMKILTTGVELKIFYLGDNRGQYSFRTRVKGMKKDQIPIILLEIPEVFERLQRRNYIRVPAYLETSYKIIEDKDSEWTIVKTIDISGGGLQYTLPPLKTITLNQDINGFIVIPFSNGTIEHINYIGKVIRVYKARDNPESNLVSVEFTSISEIMRAKIVKYCFEKQVKLKNKSIKFE